MVVPVEGVVSGEGGVFPVFACRDHILVVWLIKVGHASVCKVASVLLIVDELLSKVECCSALMVSNGNALDSGHCGC